MHQIVSIILALHVMCSPFLCMKQPKSIENVETVEHVKMQMGTPVKTEMKIIVPEEPPVEKVKEIEVDEEETYGLTDEEIDLIALVTMGEAEGESEHGKRLVIDTILNRVDHERFPDTVKEVVYQKNQFSPMWNGRIKKCYVKDDIRELVIEELKSRTNYDVVFFTSVGYSKYGKPLFKVGGHWFSSYS